MKRFVYVEDNQMYYTVNYIFETDCPHSQIMENISWSPIEAGRISTGFGKFKTLMEKAGYTVKEIKKMEKNSEVPQEFIENGCVVYGATGNY